MSKRYILVKVASKSSISSAQFETALMDSIRRSFGEFGLARIAPKLIRFNTNTSEAVVASSKEGAEDLQAAIGLISDTPETTMTAITMRVSGTIRGLRRKERF